MLTIENFKKIRNQWYGDWQIGRTDKVNNIMLCRPDIKMANVQQH